MDKKEYKFLEWGYKTAIVLSMLGLILSSAYLFYFLFKSNPTDIELDTMVGFNAERRMVLLSTAIFVAMSFGFLGFALFLIQAKGEVDGVMEYKDAKINVARMSPGLFVILCSTVIIIISVTFRVEYSQVIGPGDTNVTAPKVQVTDTVGKTDTSSYKIRNGLPEPE